MKVWFEAEPARRLLRRLAAERDLSLCQLAELLHVDRCTLTRVLAREWLRSDTADRIAVTADRHPAEIWPDYYPTGDIPRRNR
jgi:lambda repressor-like predicted transcriptional regulator